MPPKPKKILWQYAGLATQLLVALAVAAYGGRWLDEKLQMQAPLAIWLLPLLVLTGMLIRIIHDTSKKQR